MVIVEQQTVIRNPSWWKRRTRLERRTIRFSALLGFINVALLVALGIMLLGRRSRMLKLKALMPGPICSTLGCNFAASKILQDMDSSVEPCDDFYKFTCGGFLNRTIIPDEDSEVDFFNANKDMIAAQLRHCIEKPINDDEIKPFVLLKTLYKTCMNTSIIEAEGLTTIQEILNDLGGWPVLTGNDWIGTTFDWKQTMYKLRQLGYQLDYLLDFQVLIDERNTSRHIIVLNEPLVSGEAFVGSGFKHKRVRAYYAYMVDIAVLMGAARKYALEELKQIVDFEIELAGYFLSFEKARNITGQYNIIPIKDLQLKLPDVPWLEYINNVLSISSIQMVDSEQIDVTDFKYIKGVLSLLSRTPKRVVANYLLWRVVQSSVPYLNQELVDRKLKFDRTLEGITRIKPRWKKCLSDLFYLDGMKIALGAMYVRKHSSKHIKKNVLDMVSNVKNEFINLLKRSTWLDDETKKHALEKARSIITHVAYPDEYLDDDKLIEHYTKLKLTSDSYLKSILTVSLFQTNYDFGLVREPFNKTDWRERGLAADVDSVYMYEENSISFTAGILQGIIFSNDRPNYVNYGALGFLIGHEITHGFDSRGIEYDKDSNLQNWWKADTKRIFKNKAQCIIKQYDNYRIPEINSYVDGANTQEENIADHGGIRVAYLAYKSWIQRNDPELHLPGLNYSPKQMFWISFAHTWCTKYRNELLQEIVGTDPHSPNMFRIIGMLRNLEYFAEDFSCPLGSKMNPKRKCRVW